MELLQMLSKRGNGYNMATTVSLVLADGTVHLVGGMLYVPCINLSIGSKEQEKGKGKEKSLLVVLTCVVARVSASPMSP